VLLICFEVRKIVKSGVACHKKVVTKDVGVFDFVLFDIFEIPVFGLCKEGLE
jgi:hypothetical protein